MFHWQNYGQKSHWVSADNGDGGAGGAGGALAPPLLRRMTFYFVLVYLVYFIQANYFKKYLAENAVNTISETLDFKIFWGRMPPDPSTNSRLRRSFSAPPLQNTLRRPFDKT